jgi:Putative prokaryotic signal transducing protein
MVTVARYGDVNEALQLKMALEARGIEAFVPDELTATNAPYRFLTDPSGVRVQVAEEDVETARQVISDHAKAG